MQLIKNTAWLLTAKNQFAKLVSLTVILVTKIFFSLLWRPKWLQFGALTSTQRVIVLALVVQKLDNIINRINLYPVDSAIIGFPHTIRWIVIYPVDSAIHLLNNAGQVVNVFLPFLVKAQRTFGYMTTCYKATNSKDGLTYVLRRIHCKYIDKKLVQH